MSDFFSTGWSTFVTVTSIVSVIACLVLLGIAARRTVMAGDNTTGHVWDEDLRELNNPLPRWWMYLFVITVVFALAYLYLYPGAGSNSGSLGWSSRGQYETEQAKAKEQLATVYAKYAAMPADALVKDAGAMGIGERLFANNCAACHGSDGRGSKGFPNLTDNDWLGAGTHDYIKQTITEGRQGMMPPMAAAVGTAADVKNVANYVLSLSNGAHSTVAAQLGKEKFVVCAACHGPDGKGNPAIGAPNLTDKVWLHGWGEDAIISIVTNGKVNVMPKFGERFSAEQIHVLGAYVLGLSQRGGATPTPAQ